jgi:3-oxoacyl-[acyl-carrier-protein] synthase III
MPMRIASIAYATPQVLVDNDGGIDMLANRYFKAADPEARRTLLADVRGVLESCGSRERFLDLDSPAGYAMALMEKAARKALAESDLSADAIDLVIYYSVARGWLEPSTASAVQHVIGASNASCFDVLEACAGWPRALEVADALMRTGRYRTALLIGVEAGMQRFGPLGRSIDEINPGHLAAFTIGEAAAATVLLADETNPVRADFRSLGSNYHLCMVTLDNIAAFLPRDHVGTPEGMQFVSIADQLFRTAIIAGIDMWRGAIAEIGMERIGWFAPHGASARASEVVRHALDIPLEKWSCAHARFGNTGANTIPIALATAIEEGRLSRDQQVMCLVAASGITVGYCLFTY